MCKFSKLYFLLCHSHNTHTTTFEHPVTGGTVNHGSPIHRQVVVVFPCTVSISLYLCFHCLRRSVSSSVFACNSLIMHCKPTFIHVCQSLPRFLTTYYVTNISISKLVFALCRLSTRFKAWFLCISHSFCWVQELQKILLIWCCVLITLYHSQ